MALRKNTNHSPVQLNPEFQNLLVRNGMQARLISTLNGAYRLEVHGHDSPVVSYEVTPHQVKSLSDWGSNYANKTAYNTFISVVKDDFDIPRNFVHARNANSRVAMGLHGYRIGVGEYGCPERMPIRERLFGFAVPMHKPDRSPGFWGRLTSFLGWTPRQQDGYHLRRVEGAPLVPVRPDGRMKPGELQSGGYGFYYKGNQLEPSREPANKPFIDPLSELKEAFIPAQKELEPAKSYNELITSPVYFTNDKFQECLSSHGLMIDADAKLLTIQSAKQSFALQYDLTDEQVNILTSNSLKSATTQKRLDIINEVIGPDFEGTVTLEMLNSATPISLDLKPDLRLEEEITHLNEPRENPPEMNIPADLSDGYQMVADGKFIPIISEMEGHHWQQDIRGGRDVVLKDVVAYENNHQYFLRAHVNGEQYVRSLTDEQFKELHYKTDEKRIELVDNLLDGISFKYGAYKGEQVNTIHTDASRLEAIKETKGWFREGKDGREVNVGFIGVKQLGDGKYAMTGEIEGETVTREISKKDYDKFLAMDDYHRMRLFSKLFGEVDLKDRLSVGNRITAALAAGITVMGELSADGPDMYWHPPYGHERPVRAYFKPGVDTPEEVARRNYEAAINTENIQNGLRK